jgi:hypothetical protein
MRYRTSATVTANAVSGAKTAKTTESAGPVITRVDYNLEDIAFNAAKTSRSVFKKVNDYLRTTGPGGFEKPAVNVVSLILYCYRKEDSIMFTCRFYSTDRANFPIPVKNLKLDRGMKMLCSTMRGLYFITEMADEENLA